MSDSSATTTAGVADGTLPAEATEVRSVRSEADAEIAAAWGGSHLFSSSVKRVLLGSG